MLTRRAFVRSSLALAALPAMPRIARAQRPIKIVVPFAAGGGVDVFARLIAEKLRQQHGWTLIVDNRPGANGSLGANAVRGAEADGATLLFSAGTHVMARHVMKSAPFDPIDDFATIARCGEAPMLLIASPKVKPDTLGELLAEARQAPDKWMFATSALGSPGHLAELDFNRIAGLNLLIHPYRGTAPGLNDVAGGHVQLMIDPVLALLPLVQSKTVKGIAVTTAKRTALAPEFAPAADSLPGMDHASWYGVWGPKALPAAQRAELNATINAAVAALAHDGALGRIGVDAVTETPAQAEEFARAYVARNAALLKTSGFEAI